MDLALTLLRNSAVAYAFGVTNPRTTIKKNREVELRLRAARKAVYTSIGHHYLTPYM